MSQIFPQRNFEQFRQMDRNKDSCLLCTVQVAQNVPTSLKKLQQNYFFILGSFFRRGVIEESEQKSRA